MAANESRLGALHESLADRYIEMLGNPDNCNAAFLTSVAKFLKDNGIEAEKDNEKVKELKQKADNILSFPFDPAKTA